MHNIVSNSSLYFPTGEFLRMRVTKQQHKIEIIAFVKQKNKSAGMLFVKRKVKNSLEFHVCLICLLKLLASDWCLLKKFCGSSKILSVLQNVIIFNFYI